MQSSTPRGLFASVSQVHEETENLPLGYDWFRRRGLHRQHAARLLHLPADRDELVSVDGQARPFNIMLTASRSLDPETACPNVSVALVFQVGWALHFTGDILSKLLKPNEPNPAIEMT